MDALIDPGCLFDSHTMARNVRPIAVAGDEAQWRPCRIETGPLNDSADWMEHCRGIWKQSFDRLDDYLRELEEEEKTGGRKRIGILVKEPSDREIVTTRVFDAPREFVFKAWTNPDHLAHWWGPKGLPPRGATGQNGLIDDFRIAARGEDIWPKEKIPPARAGRRRSVATEETDHELCTMDR